MDISQITNYLYIAAHPKTEDADAIRDLNVRLILNMIFIRPAEVYDQPPFHMLTLRTFDSIFLPIPMGKLIKGVEAALPVIEAGEGVLVYCREGRHRSEHNDRNESAHSLHVVSLPVALYSKYRTDSLATRPVTGTLAVSNEGDNLAFQGSPLATFDHITSPAG